MLISYRKWIVYLFGSRLLLSVVLVFLYIGIMINEADGRGGNNSMSARTHSFIS